MTDGVRMREQFRVAGPDFAGGIVRHPRRVVVMPSVEERIVKLESEMASVSGGIVDIRRGVEKLNDKIDGRPSWIITTLITLLTTACGILATLVATIN